MKIALTEEEVAKIVSNCKVEDTETCDDCPLSNYCTGCTKEVEILYSVSKSYTTRIPIKDYKAFETGSYPRELLRNLEALISEQEDNFGIECTDIDINNIYDKDEKCYIF